jgi:hypothetical protein
MRLPLAVQSQVSSPAWSHLRPGILQRSMTSNTFDRQVVGDRLLRRGARLAACEPKETMRGAFLTWESEIVNPRLEVVAPTDHVLPLKPTLNVMSEMQRYWDDVEGELLDDLALPADGIPASRLIQSDCRV